MLILISVMSHGCFFCILVDGLVSIGKQVLQERNADVSKARCSHVFCVYCCYQ